ncbi:MAG: WD40/YVTN/BNR-like repeat-containing protein [Terriglobales bacterium]
MKRNMVLGVAAGAAVAIAGWAAMNVAPVRAQAGSIEQVLAKLHYRLIGPYNGARVLAVSGIPGNSKVFYFGSVDGGVWKTTNAGQNWTPLFDKEDVQSIGAIEVAPSDPNIIYVGTGEGCLRNDISYGDGMYKSTDGGKTWEHIGLTDTQHISHLVIDPKDPNRVFVAAMGHASGPNAERGIFRTVDGGQTWQKVLFKDDKTGGVDVAFDPNNTQVLYAAMYQFLRLPWRSDSGGPGSGLYKSTDGGSTWTQLAGHGLPDGVWGKIGVAVGANSSRVYALIEAKDGGLYVSNDSGASWTLANSDDQYRQRAWYFTHIFADPKSVDTVYVENTGLFRSTDGGKTFRSIHGGDSHGMWIDPTDPTHMMTSSDEGAFISLDSGRTWSTNLSQPTGQFYSIATDNDVDYHVYGEKQDAGSVVIATRTNHGSIGPQDQYGAAGGESGWLVPKPDDSNIVYGESYDGDMSRYNVKTGFTTPIGPWPDNPMGHGDIDMKYRFQWSAPIATSPWNPNEVYYGGNVLFKSTNMGNSWEIISPDLTRDDKSKQVSSGGPITQDNTSAEYYDVIFAIAESPKQEGLIWTGSDDGLVHITRDGGKSWKDVTPPELKTSKPWAKIGNITASPFSACTAYVAARRNKLDDFAPYAYRTDNCGETWTKITNGIPVGYYVQAVAPDTVRKGLLFAGTERGVFVSFNDGDQWEPLQLNLPHTSVRDLQVHGDDLVLATHGRAFWSLDDITPIRQWEPSVATAAVTLFTPEPAMRTVGGRGFGGFGRGGAVAQNPPGPAVIDYYLAAQPSGAVTIDITNAKGELMKHFSSANNRRASAGGRGRGGRGGRGGIGGGDSVPNQAGFNRFVWNLQALTPPTAIKGEALWAARGGVSPTVPTGLYTVKLTVDGQSYTRPLKVTLDPRLHASQADLDAQWTMAVNINHKLTEAWGAVRQMLALQGQIVRADKSGPSTVSSAGAALNEKLHGVIYEIANLNNKSGEDPLNYPIMLDNKLAALAGRVEECTCAPTTGVQQVYDLLTSQLNTQLAAWRTIQARDVQSFNSLLQQNNLQPVTVEPASAQR